MTLKKFFKELNGNRIEGELIKTIFMSLVSSMAVLVLLYFIFFTKVPQFRSKYLFFILFATFSFVLITPALRQIRAYRRFSCMSGMMIGMTLGMATGFLIGFYVGATNGMFFGGLMGMSIGIIIGIWAGSSCGVMGFMEGIMAGFMGGWMGAMTSVMLMDDHLKEASILIFFVNAVIIFSLNYMIYTQTKETERLSAERDFLIVTITIIVTLVLTYMIMNGPRGGVFLP